MEQHKSRCLIHSQLPVTAILATNSIQAAAAALGIWSKCKVASPFYRYMAKSAENIEITNIPG